MVSILCLLYTCSIHIYVQDISQLKKPKKCNNHPNLPLLWTIIQEAFPNKVVDNLHIIYYFFYECLLLYNGGDALLVTFAQIHGQHLEVNDGDS